MYHVDGARVDQHTGDRTSAVNKALKDALVHFWRNNDYEFAISC